MNIGGVLAAAERVLAEVVEAAEAAGEAEAGAASTAVVATAPGTRADHNAETAAVQPFVRPPPSAHEAPRPQAGEASMVQPGASGHPMAADQLVPAMLSSLQVDPASAWPLVAQAFVAVQAPRPKATRSPPPQPAEAAPVADDTAVEETAPRVGERDARAEVEDSVVDDWCGPLERALRAALAAPEPPPSLLAAAEQWRRGRCVVLACPQGRDPAGAAWAFVLWPRTRASHRLELRGTRVEGRLHWAALPPAAPWCHVRVVKEHHPRRGRQLIPLDAMAGAAVACEVQLGPVMARALRWSVVCLRVDAVRRFWSALGAQWSATVVVSARPLVGEGSPC